MNTLKNISILFLFLFSLITISCKKETGSSNSIAIDLYEPIENDTVFQNQRVMIRAFLDIDMYDVDIAELYIDGVLYDTDEDNISTWTWTTLDVSIGSHTIEVKARDKSGNTGSKSIHITVVENKITFNPEVTYGSVTDIDGNTYKTVTIGTQTWMAEDLRTTRYRNGTKISYYSSLSKGPEFLALGYNWQTVVSTNKLAPTGWHIPSYSEWQILVNYLGSWNTAGTKLIESGTNHWNSASNGTNSTGFTALPYNSDGSFMVYWTTTENSTDDNKAYGFYINGSSVNLNDTPNKTVGLNVRCIKD